MTRILATIAPTILLATAAASFAGELPERTGPLHLAAAESGKAPASAPATAAKKEDSAPSMKPAAAPADSASGGTAAPKLNMNAPAKNPGPDTDLRNCLDRSTDREVIRCTEGKG